MSPLSLRRYRAERLLREEFDGLRERVLANVRGKLRAAGAALDQGDLEACYAIAWQGLYTAVLDGQEIANPSGWLVVVTFRRALDEQRARARADRHDRPWSAPERDLAAELDDRARLRQLFEGLRGRLDGREREAATLCYLQGLSRADAAARMGVSEARMRKLMEGRGPGRPGVAGKVGALVQSISAGDWCEEQGSLMRAFAYGVLDPDGERYRLALIHSGQCPACRAYVASLRGLAAVLPPVLLPWGLGAAVLAQAGGGVHASGGSVHAGGGGAHAGGGGAHAGGGGAHVGGGAGVGAQAGRSISGAVSASGAAGVGGGAGGGWLLSGGPLGAKLAVGCLLALGVGAGCVAIEAEHHGSPSRHGRHSAPASGAGGGVLSSALYEASDHANAGADTRAGGHVAATARLTPAAKASREFGPEQALAADAARSVGAGRDRVTSERSASADSGSTDTVVGSSAGRARVSATTANPSSGPSVSGSSTGDSAAAEREFAPG